MNDDDEKKHLTDLKRLYKAYERTSKIWTLPQVEGKMERDIEDLKDFLKVKYGLDYKSIQEKLTKIEVPDVEEGTNYYDRLGDHSIYQSYECRDQSDRDKDEPDMDL
jgi:hypothetical protein